MDALGNRGRCAQPCRLPYELITEQINYGNKPSSSDSNNYDILDKGHLLSTRDLCSLDLIPHLINLGITCFKIEGRLKNPEYVSTVTRIYRKYIDLAKSNKPYIIDENDRKDLLQVFNRGEFGTGYLDSKPNNNLIYKQKPNNMGIFIGTVHNFNSNKGYITLKLLDDISIGDTVSLEKEKGSYTISELMINNKNVPTAKKGDIVKIGRLKGKISVSDKIFKMSSKKLNILADEYINGEKTKQKINCKISVHKDTPISMNIYTNILDDNIYKGINFTITSDMIPIDSINSPITENRIIEQINKLGGTPFEFDKIDVDLDSNLYIPSISKLNQLRRDCINKLDEILLDRIHRNFKANLDTCDLNQISTEPSCIPKVSILLNNIFEDCDYSILTNVDRIYIPLKFFYDSKLHKKIVEITGVADTYIYMPPVLKDDIMNNLKNTVSDIVSNFTIKGFVISNISHLHFFNKSFNGYELIANYNMNVYNNYTINELQKLNVTLVTISPELDELYINSINTNTQIEAIVYGSIPVMTTNYCLLSKSNFCLSKCSNNCGNKNTKYYLKDRFNKKFRVIPDSLYRTSTIYNSRKTDIDTTLLRVNSIRFDFLDEDIYEMCEIIADKLKN